MSEAIQVREGLQVREGSAADEHVLRTALERVAGTVLEVSHAIHARPEIRFEEYFASGLLADTLKRKGFA
ncbi:hypothetical protein AB4074_22355, partial [Arthrobacter sp. 2MCAF14]